jgi:hypothetical protein
VTAKATPPVPKPSPDTRSRLHLAPARYVPLTPEQEREAITALAQLLALVRERCQAQQQPEDDPGSAPDS